LECTDAALPAQVLLRAVGLALLPIDGFQTSPSGSLVGWVTLNPGSANEIVMSSAGMEGFLLMDDPATRLPCCVRLTPCHSPKIVKEPPVFEMSLFERHKAAMG
jgi:hypothetical protein